MEMQQIRHFVAAVQHGNIRRAADALNITQPALTRSIQKLEHTLQVELLERNSRGVTITTFGKVFLEFANSFLNESDRVIDQLKQLRGTATGELRIGLGSNYVDLGLSPALINLIGKRPHATVSVKEDFFSSLIEQLIAGSIEVMVSLCPDGFTHADLAIERIGKIEAQVFGRAEHPLFKPGRIVPLKALRDAQWAGLGSKELDRFFDRIFSAHGLKAPSMVFRTNSVRLLKEMVANTDMLVLFQDSGMRDEIKTGRCVAIPTAMGALSADVSVIYRKRLANTPLLEEFLKGLRRYSRPRRRKV
jgi:DNA-binding transcriptional LysR family regulator